MSLYELWKNNPSQLQEKRVQRQTISDSQPRSPPQYPMEILGGAVSQSQS